ncbi:MAG TPA: hypothetical protein PK668_03505 [Myxococcota bacterium]|nr:hypothetical protein [Myxococcota bacterium]HRY91922.1 hypothetical protein [Myxococcota bacterium]HSA21106.1 hypothetical protein [Myxococcota bacterium]
MRAPWLRLILALVLGLALLLPVLASAQSEESMVVYKKTTHITFDKGDVIEVGVERPDADVYQLRPPTTGKSYIRLREDWKDRVLASARGS